MRYEASSSFVTANKHAVITRRDALTILLVLGGLASLRCIRQVSQWDMTHWTFSYQYGFIKRGLVGEIVSRVFGAVTPTIINFLSLGVILLLASALVYLFINPALKSQRVGAWLFAIVAVTHSATIPHLVFDRGRFDEINLLILLGCLFILSRPSPPGFRLIVLPPLCLVGLLIHEAFFIMFLPLIFAVWIYEERRDSIWPKFLVLLILTASTWAISTYGLVSNFSLQDYIALLQNRHSFAIVKDSVVPLFRNLNDNVAVNLMELRDYSSTHITHHIVLALTLLPTFGLFRKLLRDLCFVGDAGERQTRLLMAVAALAPLSLYLIATDYYRWWSIAITNLFIVFAYLAMRGKSEISLADAVESSPLIVACILGVSLVFGPLGNTVGGSYPFIDLWFLPSWHFTW